MPSSVDGWQNLNSNAMIEDNPYPIARAYKRFPRKEVVVGSSPTGSSKQNDAAVAQWLEHLVDGLCNLYGSFSMQFSGTQKQSPNSVWLFPRQPAPNAISLQTG